MSSRPLTGAAVTIVDACLRHGRGGSPTALSAEAQLTDQERQSVPARAGTSHAVFVAEPVEAIGEPSVTLRFFTSTGELPACGHGTVAALAWIAQRREAGELRMTVSAGGRSFAGQVRRLADGLEASFDPGPITTRRTEGEELACLRHALGLEPEAGGSAHVASAGRERLLLSVPDRHVLAGLAPDPEVLRTACDRFGLLGCYVYAQNSRDTRLAARMFAPSIGVPEDIANANSTACLAAVLAERGRADIAVDMGDSLGSPATIIASATRTRTGLAVRVGGIARINRAFVLAPS